MSDVSGLGGPSGPQQSKGVFGRFIGSLFGSLFGRKVSKTLPKSLQAGTPRMTHAALEALATLPTAQPSSRGQLEGRIKSLHPDLLKNTSREQPLFFTFQGKPAKMWNNRHDGISMQIDDGNVISISKNRKHIFFDDGAQGIDINNAKAEQGVQKFCDILDSIVHQLPKKTAQAPLPKNWDAILGKPFLRDSSRDFPLAFVFQGKTSKIWENIHGGISIQIPGEPLISVSIDQQMLYVNDNRVPLNSPQIGFFRGMFIQALNTALETVDRIDEGDSPAEEISKEDEELLAEIEPPPDEAPSVRRTGEGDHPPLSVPTELATSLYSFLKAEREQGLPGTVVFTNSDSSVFTHPTMPRICVSLRNTGETIDFSLDGKAYDDNGFPYPIDQETFNECSLLLQQALEASKAASFQRGHDQNSLT